MEVRSRFAVVSRCRRVWGLAVVGTLGILGGAGERAAGEAPELLVQTGHSASVFAVAMSRDGQLLLTGSHDHTAIIWDVASGDMFRRLQGHSALVNAVAFSHDGMMVATGSQDETAMLWEVATGKKMHVLKAHVESPYSDGVASVAFSPDDRSLLTGADDSSAILWDTATGKKLQSFPGHTDGVSSAIFDHTGRKVLTGSRDGTARLWDVAGPKLLSTILAGKPDSPFQRVTGAILSPDGAQILVGVSDGSATLWNSRNGEKLNHIPGEPHDDIRSMAFSEDGRHVCFGHFGKAVIWDAKTGAKVREFERPTFPFELVRYDKKLALAVSVEFNGCILWDVASGNKIREFRTPPDRIQSVAFAADGQSLALGINGGPAVFELSALKSPARGQGLKYSADCVAISPGGSFVLAGCAGMREIERTEEYASAAIWDAVTGEKRLDLHGHTSGVEAVAFDPCSNRAVTGSADNSAVLWDVVTGNKLRSIYPDDNSVRVVDFSRDGRRILTAGGGIELGRADLWDADSGRRIRAFEGHDRWVISAAISPDAKRIVTGSFDDTAILWDTRNGKMLHRLIGHDGSVAFVAFSPSGKEIYTASNDGTVMQWDAGTGEKLRTLELPRVRAVCLSPDGGRLLTIMRDHAAAIWDVRTGREIVRLYLFNSGQNWLAITPQGFYDGSPSGCERVTWRQGDKVYPAEKHDKEFHRPDVVSKLLHIPAEKVIE